MISQGCKLQKNSAFPSEFKTFLRKSAKNIYLSWTGGQSVISIPESVILKVLVKSFDSPPGHK